MNFSKKNIIIVVIIALCIAIVGLAIEKIINEKQYEESIEQQEENTREEKEKDEINETETQEVDDSEEESIEQISTGNKIYVYVAGEVNNKGVVILNEGSRIVDAIESAGGITDKADISKINLAYVLEDGTKINIPSKDELKNNDGFRHIISGADESDNENTSSENSAEVKAKENIKKNSRVNINNASQTELETLPGIGPSLALKIINYRNENGKFKVIDDIKNVSGIGENKYKELEKYITV